MKLSAFTLAAVLCAAPLAVSAQTTTLVARTGFDEGKYYFTEVLHTTEQGGIFGGGFMALTGHPKEQRDLYAGAGHNLPFIPGVMVQAVAFVQRSSGSTAIPTTSIVPWILAYGSLGQVVLTGNYLAFAPLLADGTLFQKLEHAKAEWDFGPWLAGAGVQAIKDGDTGWQSTPFLTGTLKHQLGSFEVWVVDPANSARTYQLRYLRSF